MKKVLLQLMLAMLSVAAFAQSVDHKIKHAAVPKSASFPEWHTEILQPKIYVTKDIITITDLEASFKIIQLSDNSIIHEEVIEINFPAMMDIIADFSEFSTEGLFIGDYQLRYDISSNSPDPNLTNNEFIRNFTITDRKFAFGHELTHFIYPTDAAYDEGEMQSWAYGNSFYSESLPIDANLGVVKFNIGNPLDYIGDQVNLLIYTWNDNNGDKIIDPVERKLTAFGVHVFTGSETPGEDIEVQPLTISEGGYWTMEQNKTILFALEHLNLETETPIQIGVDEHFSYQEPWAFNPIIPNIAYPHFGIFAGANGDLSITPYNPTPSNVLLGGQDGINYFLPMSASFEVVFPLPTKERAKSNNAIKLLENPIQNLLQLEINSQALQLRYINIYNTMGQALYSEKLDRMSNSIEISVGDFPNGTYHVIITGDNGNAASTFVKTN